MRIMTSAFCDWTISGHFSKMDQSSTRHAGRTESFQPSSQKYLRGDRRSAKRAEVAKNLGREMGDTLDEPEMLFLVWGWETTATNHHHRAFLHLLAPPT